jgi:AraC family transcriptional activator of mtrCDE
MDVLSDILQTLRLRGTVYFHARFHAPWGMRIAEGKIANFHLVTDGVCWVKYGEDAHLAKLQRGDMAIFPRGDSHSLLYEKQGAAVPAKELLEAPRSGESLSFGGEGAATTSLICGHFDYDREFPHPLFETLDAFIHIPRQQISDSTSLTTISELAATLSENDHPGAHAAVDRLAEALFIQALAAHVASRQDSAGFLSAMQDRQLGNALNLMHEDIAREWTLAELARTASMSRTVFSARFRALTGEPPMLYLARWRMLKARELLLDTTLTLGRISEKVGYRSEFAFSKAFKRLLGRTPGNVRRETASI